MARRKGTAGAMRRTISGKTGGEDDRWFGYTSTKGGTVAERRRDRVEQAKARVAKAKHLSAKQKAAIVKAAERDEFGAEGATIDAANPPIFRSKGSSKKGEKKKKRQISEKRLQEILQGKTEPAHLGADRTTPLQKRGGGPVYRKKGSPKKGEKKIPEPTATTPSGMSTPAIMISIVSPNTRLGPQAKARKVLSGGKTAAERRTGKLQSAALSKVMKAADGGAVVAARHNRASSGRVSRGAGIAVKGIKFRGVR